ncbi:cytidyltransferase-related domain protein [Methanosalsum zhilinae DSM 4017]|uniref:Phosphopantetheine adenylyltransferase n=1 Tax=Methanosalsum zhilinae (strain DSM 4017 / NBRC 107636 / OCM 62 / WeN5) TaxID=679901 RepID=F7XKQ3_METZD|nr:phosphopantetheine adenylyltransferase [Methanosalsum zhilinae]AEH61766.1 cytidyltransferase-related domain protein [Methanosalsum zhilinae DSM 4017]
MAKVAVGGTFEYLHDGHKKLINKAFELASDGEVHIGITSDRMARRPDRRVSDYNTRKNLLIRYISDSSLSETDYHIYELNNPYGLTLKEDYDCIVVSPETYDTALKINDLRINSGYKPIEIIRIDYVMGQDGLPISSTRISQGIIDAHGRLLK